MYDIHLKFAVFGSSGSGKSSLIEIVEKLAQNISVHKKDTTRPMRDIEREILEKGGENDLNFLDKPTFFNNLKKGEYVVKYQKYGNWYGLREDQLVDAFKNKEIHFVIIRDISALQQFKFMYSDVKALYIHADPENIPDRLKKRDGIEFEERLKRNQQEYAEFIENNTLFNHVILNFWEIDNAVRQLRNILHSYVRKATTNL